MDNSMLADTVRAGEFLKNGNYTCVLIKNDIVYTSEKRGVQPLVTWFEENTNLSGFSAADKVVGKAAAFMYILLKVKEVYTPVISDSALDILKQYKISTHFDVSVKAIINRAGNGYCPMEQAVYNISSPDEAFKAIKNKLISLSNDK